MKNCIATLAALLFLAVVTACSSLPKEGEIARSLETESFDPILFVADPQIHNIYGLGLKQMLGVSDLVSKVAIRRPELNILAPLVLESLIEQSVSSTKLNAIIVLGDVTNIACSGEYDTYISSAKRHKPVTTPLLMAHGNHDSYLMGTVNHYFPIDSQENWKPAQMETSSLPTDESWWAETKISSLHARNWRDGCYQPSTAGDPASSPMNKSRWLARYMHLLASDGMVSKSIPKQVGSSTNSAYVLELSAKPNSALGIRKFSAKGVWYPPQFGDVPSKSYFTGTYNSFIVQTLDIDETRIVIIDTSVCEKAQGGWKFIFNNAGQNACLGQEQLKVIRDYVQSIPTNTKLVIAGHFPLKDLSRKERRKLLDIVSSSSDWVYMSAHSHHEISQLSWNTGAEINVGSTTDWPMEANVVWFGSSKKTPHIRTYNINKQPIAYIGTQPNESSEVCRHLPAAEKLASLDPRELSTTWVSPKGVSDCHVSDESSWNYYGAALSKAVIKIRSRYETEPKYREAILKIAASASKDEYESFDFADLIP